MASCLLLLNGVEVSGGQCKVQSTKNLFDMGGTEKRQSFCKLESN